MQNMPCGVLCKLVFFMILRQTINKTTLRGPSFFTLSKEKPKNERQPIRAVLSVRGLFKARIVSKLYPLVKPSIYRYIHNLFNWSAEFGSAPPVPYDFGVFSATVGTIINLYQNLYVRTAMVSCTVIFPFMTFTSGKKYRI
jgi:hypothetical protein